jgi:hypothetical protein
MIIDDIPEGYSHKATSESLLRTESVCIYYSNVDDLYLIMIDSMEHEPEELYLTKSQLTLLIQSATDTLEMDTR